MRRREFIAIFTTVLVALAGPLSQIARAAGNRPRIGYLSIVSADADASNLDAFRRRLELFGYAEGRTVDIDYRFSNGSTEALTGLAQELLQMKPDVVLASAVSPARAVKGLAPALPIVCAAFSDSFIPTLAASFAHPGGSVTGVASDVEQLIGKLVELALDAVPGISKIGFLANPAGGSMTRFEQQIQSTAQLHGLKVEIVQVEKSIDIDDALQALKRGNAQAVIVPENGLLISGRKQIIELAMSFRLPLIFGTRQGVLAGGLVSYGINPTERYEKAANYVAKILKGTAPGDIPIEFPSKVELVINRKTARALGLKIPPSLLDRADEVIE